MPDILHKVGIKSSSPDDVYEALTAIAGLSRWWTSDTRGESKVGGVLQFRFGDDGFDMKVVELKRSKRVLWQVGLSFSSNTRAGRNRWNSCTTAAPNGRSSC
jgi:uncharacterized protein YndB with AHSA1/START domain